jgi:hypothetical protein
LAREVDVQSSHPGSNPHRCEFGFLFSKNQIAVGASPTAFPFKKKLVSGWDYPASRKIPLTLLFFGRTENPLPSGRTKSPHIPTSFGVKILEK